MPAGIREVIRLKLENKKPAANSTWAAGFWKIVLRSITRSSRHHCGDASMHDGCDRL
jgi:hypothetical protein